MSAAGIKAGIRIAVAILAMSAAPAKAAVDTGKDDYFDLPPELLLNAEVVSVSRSSGTTFESPAAVFVITQDDIARSGATTIPEILRMAPGVQVARTDSNGWAVSIRGFNAALANKVLVMIDGRTLYNPLHSGTYWEAQNLMPENIERIEVVRGPGGTLWGANAVNGVINIITKTAQETQGSLLSHGYGNHERGFVNGRHGGAISDNAFYRVYANYFNRDSFRDSPTGDMDSPDEWRGYRGGFRVDWNQGAQDKITLNGDAYRVDSGQFAQNFFLTAPFSSVTPATAKNTGTSIQGRWEHGFDGGALLSVQSFIDYTTRDETLLQDDRVIFDLETVYNFQPMGRHEIIAGAGYRYMMDNLGGSVLVGFDPGSRNDPLYSAFVQDRIALAPDELYLTLGSKFEQHHYTDFEIQPNARLQWFPDERQTVWASVSRAVRTPSRVERDLILTNLIIPPNPFFPVPTEIQLRNNKDFGTEKLIAYEIGYRNQITPALSLDATAFVNNYHDLISTDTLTAVPVAGPPAFVILPLIYRNEMSAETYGAELAADWNVNSDWNLSATYSYLEIFLHAPLVLGTTQDTAEGNAPVHQASFRSAWNIDDAWTLDTALYYVDEFHTADVPGYVRFDANLGWRIGDNLQANLVGQNLFNDDRAEFSPTGVNASEVGTSIFAKLTWQLP